MILKNYYFNGNTYFICQKKIQCKEKETFICVDIVSISLFCFKNIYKIYISKHSKILENYLICIRNYRTLFYAILLFINILTKRFLNLNLEYISNNS